MDSQHSASEYVLGHSGSELQRLIARAEVLRPSTERLFRAAGIEPGMRVLDLGCGAGDVSFLLSQMVGANGAVVGVDRAASAIDFARQRAAGIGIANVTFVCSEADNLDSAGPFDAAVGRLFLLHQPDPVATVKRAAMQVHAAGLIIFQELDLSLTGSSTWPSVELYERCMEWTIQAQERCGVQIDVGKRLYGIFKAAGLPGPRMRMERELGGHASHVMAVILATLVRSLLPKIEMFGIASASEVEIDTLAERLETALIAAEAITIGTPMIGAWSHKP